MGLRRVVGKSRRMLWAKENWEGFRLGYITALGDIERAEPNTDEARRAADRALSRLVDGPPSDPSADIERCLAEHEAMVLALPFFASGPPPPGCFGWRWDTGAKKPAEAGSNAAGVTDR